MQSPPTPFMCGMATHRVADAATAASIALPPARRIAAPASAALWCPATTMPASLIRIGRWAIMALADEAGRVHEGADPVGGGVEGGVLEAVEAARARQVDRHDLPDPPRPRGHDDDFIGQEDGLHDAVRDEQDGLTGLEPDAL